MYDKTRYNKMYREKNKVILKEKKMARISANREFYKAREREYRQTHVGRFHTMKAGAKKKNLEFNLSKDEFVNIVSAPCTYCGENILKRGIDRIDNMKGYIKENSTSACRRCNFLKKATSVNDFLSHIEKIYTHLWQTKKK